MSENKNQNRIVELLEQIIHTQQLEAAKTELHQVRTEQHQNRIEIHHLENEIHQVEIEFYQRLVWTALILAALSVVLQFATFNFTFLPHALAFVLTGFVGSVFVVYGILTRANLNKSYQKQRKIEHRNQDSKQEPTQE